MNYAVPAPAPWGVLHGLRYGLIGFPLAFCALPLYVWMPNMYAREWGVSLAALGAVLLGARLLDAIIDPLLGRLCDRLYARSLRAVLLFGAAAAMVLALGFSLLFVPPLQEPELLVRWAAVWLVVTYAAYSALSIAHQSWGAKLGGDAVFRSRVVAWREGLGLVGVVMAAVTPAVGGVPMLLALLLVGLAAGMWAWTRAQRPPTLPLPVPGDASAASATLSTRSWLWLPWRNAAFRRLLAVYLVNGIASAIPATLVLFFVQDRLQAGESMQSAALGLYFVSGALSMPVWLQCVRRWGLERSWLLGMVLSIAAFLGASLLGAGDAGLFLVVCVLSGFALGSDLALPGALLAGMIAQAGDQGRAEGAYFGWWNFATKLNLALAAGLALPLLGWLGYAPGARDAHALQMLTVAYCLVPCGLKALAAVSLVFLIPPRTAVQTTS
jgi:Na+/melibiose symporter-like transporter